MAVAKPASVKPATSDDKAQLVQLRIPSRSHVDVVRDEDHDVEITRGVTVAVAAPIAKRLLDRPGPVVEQVNPRR